MESWRSVPGWKGFYEVSDLGRVRSLTRICQCYGGPNKKRRYIGRVLATYGIKYPIVILSRPGGKPHTYNVHRLVMLAFEGPPPKGTQICHNNDNPQDNRLSNLRYDTCIANLADAKKNGKLKPARGENTGSAKLRNKEVIKIRQLSLSLSGRALARKFKVHHTTIQNILKGITWTHLT